MSTRAQDVRWTCPPEPPAVIERPRLLARLDASLQRPLTWITAPAGYGKSVLMSQWCRQKGDRPVAWFDARVSEEDGELATLRRAIAHLARHDPDSPEGGSLSIAATAMSCPPSILVVDDCRSETLAFSLLDLAAALERAGTDGLRIIVTSRESPPAQASALTLRGACTVIHAGHFELTAAETAAIINELIPGSIDHPTAQQLCGRLQGWVAGARLIGLNYRTRSVPSVERLFDAAAHAIEAYLAAEILGEVDAADRRFLLLTAAVDHAPARLCDAMTGERNSERRLLRLQQAGLPMSAEADNGTLVHLQPVREALDRMAIREVPEERATAVRAAAEWYSRDGRPFEAAWLLVGLQDWDAVIDVVFRHMKDILESDQMGELAELAAAAPVEVIRERSDLALGAAYALRMDGRIAQAMELLAVFEPYMRPLGRAIANTTRSGTVSSVPDIEAPLAYAAAAIAAWDQLDADGVEPGPGTLPIYSSATIDTYRTIARSYALLACAYAGLWERGQAYLVDVDPDTAAKLPHVQVLQRHGSRATYLALGGCAEPALREATTGLTLADTAGMRDHRLAADAHFGRGEALRLMLRHDEADDALATSHELASLNARINLLASITASRAHLAVDRGDPDAAIAAVSAFRRRDYRPPITLDGLIAAAEARAQLAVGRTAAALHTLEEGPWTTATAGTLASSFASLGQISNARRALERWPHRATADASVRFQLATAIVHEVAGQRSLADAAFAAALDLAARDRLLQPFSEVGAVGMQLLQRVTRRTATPTALVFAVTLRAATMASANATSTSALTAREATILAHLAADLTVQEIAETVHLSVNTVKTHLKSLYRKLGVSSRADAVRTAHASRRNDAVDGQ